MLTVGNPLWHAMMQILVPAQMLGRASSVDWLFSLCPTPLGVLAGGVLATSVGVRETFEDLRSATAAPGHAGTARCRPDPPPGRSAAVFRTADEPPSSCLFAYPAPPAANNGARAYPGARAHLSRPPGTVE